MTYRLSLTELQRLGMTVPTIEALLESQDTINDGVLLSLAAAPMAARALAGLSALERCHTYTSVDYTATGSEGVVVAGTALTVYLNDTPDEGEELVVKRATTDGYVVVDGNGKNIDGDSDFTMVVNYDSYTFRYVDDAGEWLIV